MYDKILKLAKDKGVTLADVSRATGITESAFSNMKTRGGAMTFENVAKVAEYFGVSLDYFTHEG